MSTYHVCYKCSRENFDYEWSSLCTTCRAMLHNPSLDFLGRLTPDDLLFLEDMKIKVEPDMRKAVARI